MDYTKLSLAEVRTGLDTIARDVLGRSAISMRDN